MLIPHFPPRSEHPVPVSNLPAWETPDYIAQAKLNGSYAVIHINQGEITAFNRHKQPLSNFTIPKSEILALYDMSRCTGELVLCGEFLNKGQKDETGTYPKYLALHDILVKETFLYQYTYHQRYALLEEICGYPKTTEHYLREVSDNIKLFRNFADNFCQHFNELVSIPVVEGLVVKKLKSPLRYTLKPTSNQEGQFKFRKPNSNYKL
jgi:ATP-dependent DNA ligase